MGIKEFLVGGDGTTVRARFRADAFGNVLATTLASGVDAARWGSASYRHAGNHHDADAGLFYFHNRWYHAPTGRFTQRRTPFQPLFEHPYAYAEHNPAAYWDPSGFAPGPDWLPRINYPKGEGGGGGPIPSSMPPASSSPIGAPLFHDSAVARHPPIDVEIWGSKLDGKGGLVGCIRKVEQLVSIGAFTPISGIIRQRHDGADLFAHGVRLSPEAEFYAGIYGRHVTAAYGGSDYYGPGLAILGGTAYEIVLYPYLGWRDGWRAQYLSTVHDLAWENPLGVGLYLEDRRRHGLR